MTIHGRQKIVVLGMMGRLRVGGGVWQTLHYLVGLNRLGYDAYYIEAHGSVPWAFQTNENAAAEFIESIMRRFDMADRWAFHARGGSERYYGMTKYQVNQLYKSAAVTLNLHGGTIPSEEQSASGRLVYVDTDPVRVQIQINDRVQSILEVLEQHWAFFTFAENYGNADCKLPLSDRFPFKPTRQPVVLDFWKSDAVPTEDAFTTVGNWKQIRRVVEQNGEEYHWSKHLEFLKFIEVPKKTKQVFELALSSCDEDDRKLLLEHGWNLRDAFGFSQDMDAYRQYVLQSKGEFTVAKDQNIRFRTGWFSDRSATYLAAARPVITQETGFSNVLPSGYGLLGFSNIDEILDAVETINGDYEGHRHAAQQIAHEYFSHDVVLGQLLSHVGISQSIRGGRAHASDQPIAVNVIGETTGFTGMSSTVRRYVVALESIGVNVQLFDASHISDATLSRTANPAINIVCCEVASHFAVRSRLGEDFFRGRYNIGIWLWETPTFPNEWYDRFAYYDEIWAPTSFIASVLAPISPVPVVRMPMVLAQELSGSRGDGRRQFAIADNEFVYLFIFNFRSRVQRKNPQAVIDSFKNAFTPTEAARLIVKCSNSDFNQDYFREMKRSAEGHRISIIDGDSSEREIRNLVAASDCYVSLHRAEGVGLTISDAMAAGKPVIATGWSGNMDFMTVANSYPIRYEMRQLDQNIAHYRAGDVWAEACIQHAAETMRHVFMCRDEAAGRAERAKEDIQTDYSSAAVGKSLAARLVIVSRDQQFRLLRQQLNTAFSNVSQLVSDFGELGQYVPSHHLQYLELKRKLRDIVQQHVPVDGKMAVVSKGDDDLLKFLGCGAGHFPQDAAGNYSGYHPQNSADAILHVEHVRADGSGFLLFPNTAFWWLDHYDGLREHLFGRYKVMYKDESCLIFALMHHNS
jgi:glycosyltransferase involved in cell wall biosynthesis